MQEEYENLKKYKNLYEEEKRKNENYETIF